RDYMKTLVRRERSVSFEHIFAHCQDRLHAIFLFLSVLELVQQKFMKIMLGEGRNNFLLEYENSEAENDIKI
ncbi:MAG TPA: hypothetical protein VK084_04895, partial [Chitinophagaceae bacterium]|nr:hypothetical protein [Chitinophagaceae bacterium]